MNSPIRAAVEHQMTVFDLATIHFHLFLQIDPGTLMVLIQAVRPALRRGRALAGIGRRADNGSPRSIYMKTSLHGV